MNTNESNKPGKNASGKAIITRKVIGVSEVEFEPDDCYKKLKAENERLKTELAAKDKELAELKEKLSHATFFVSEEIIGETKLEGDE